LGFGKSSQSEQTRVSAGDSGAGHGTDFQQQHDGFARRFEPAERRLEVVRLDVLKEKNSQPIPNLLIRDFLFTLWVDTEEAEGRWR
jgi:hypothetical protein